MYGEVAAGVRATPLRHFPYVAYYRIDGDRVVILSITHGRLCAARMGRSHLSRAPGEPSDAAGVEDGCGWWWRAGCVR